MKKIIIYLLSICFMLLVGAGCKTVIHVKSSDPAPPGQVKKMTGSKSAKPYAPGQQKEKNNQKNKK